MIRMKDLRKEQGYSQIQVATMLGITQQAYANYERGARQADYETLSKLSNFFGVSIDYILGNTDDPNAPTLDQQLEGVSFALYGETKDLTEEQKQDILDYIKFKKQQWKTSAE